ncbi:uncharacterized protein Fot_32400 [Forsythia ovata]|uniref:EF-hand domain-containing protein n=1 Tax=Forsythia ovata TaxID=205694 RepID=A0ABD1T7P4_9LAMI
MLARTFFGTFDDNGDGKISLQEFESIMSSSHSNGLFKKLDENGDGILDFNEVLAFYYMVKTGIRSCNSCNKLLLGPYFSCAMCLGKGSETYDLCCGCYSGGDYSHEHSSDNFMDTRAQLKLLRDLMERAEITPIQTVETNQDVLMRSTSKKGKALQGVNTALKIANVCVEVGNVAVNAEIIRNPVTNIIS